jgi:hypothetical protein
VNALCNTLTRKPYAGNPHVRFDEGEGFLRNPLYSTLDFLGILLSLGQQSSSGAGRVRAANCF